DVQAGKITFSSEDIVVDLPTPPAKVFFWCDHHLTTKPKEALPKNQYWKIAPSCAGFLINIALEKGAKATKELHDFKKAIDTIDNAEYSKKEMKDCFYKQKGYENLTSLQRLTMIGAMFNTRDRVLNDEIFRTLLTSELGETPLSSKSLWQLNPLLFHKAQLESFELWRKNVDTYITYDQEAHCVVQDDRLAKINVGVPDRFYSYLKFPQASYHVNLRIIEEEKKCRFGLGSNIFHKERCKVNIGELCREVGKKFNGSGGGHFAVGGAVIKADKADEALKFVLERFREEK
ncbi:MAG: DHH family phosphoesterase, partial [Nanoarchaeota archaeon]